MPAPTALSVGGRARPRCSPHSCCHPEQGWSLLCNGVLVFEDTGELLPDGRVIAPHRARTSAVTTAA